ncbi:unnamed protein product [Mytilus coruscus]|uniref:Reverse transcriptase domain-containing protein n=1 Tax=Mytilus coruscus TaxID=42192 RepID=A0A6J8ENG1_MYTCO|nr:unnamed protein product [Mytilus coruscus]
MDRFKRLQQEVQWEIRQANKKYMEELIIKTTQRNSGHTPRAKAKNGMSCIEWEKCVPAIYSEAVKKSLDQNKNRKVTMEDQTTNLIDAIKQAARKTIPTKNSENPRPKTKSFATCKKVANDYSDKFNPAEISEAISNLNNGKARDEYGLSAEHFKSAEEIVVPYLVSLFNQILAEKKVPIQFKTGILNVVCKKNKDDKILDNYNMYKGITVSSIIGKNFEHVILNRVLLKLDKQSELQFGFTSGLSPAMAALLVSESELI